MHALLLAALLARAAVEDAVHAFLRAQHVAGLSIGVVRHGSPAFERGYGFADLGRRTPASAQTIYRIGSLSKSFTAAAILALQREGRLQLDDSASHYVDSFPWAHGVTIGELLAQRSGIPNYSDTALDRGGTYAPAQLVEAVASQPLAFAPGTSFEYSNTNYVLLGMIAQRAAGVPFASYLQSSVLEPARLSHTAYGDQPGEARGYARDTLHLPVPRSSLSYAFSAAGMTSNVPDLLRWLQQAQPPYYGFFEADVYGYPSLFATGNVDGYSALALFAPRNRDAIVILTNANALDLLPLAKSVFAQIETPKPDTYAHGFEPAQNENPHITAQVRAYLERTLPSAAKMTALEFTGREIADGETKDTYRVTFSDGARTVISVRYSAETQINGFTLQPQ
jgi:CubicO group peptidase (beta-lactamase class C family)